MSEHKVETAPDITQVKGHKVTLRLKQTAPQSQGKTNDIFGRRFEPNVSCELLIDDKPINALIQHIKVEADAESMIPLLSLTIIPTELDVEVDAALAEVQPEIVRAFCLTDNKVRYAKKLPDTPDVNEIIKKYREEFPASAQ